jgi:hypothetical protein
VSKRFGKNWRRPRLSTVSSPVMKLGSFDTTQKPNDNQCSGKQLTLQDQKKTWMFKTMLVIFFNIQGIIMTQYVPPGQTVNQTHYIELLTKLRGKILRDLSCGRMVGFSTRTTLQCTTQYQFDSFWQQNKFL